MSDKEEVIFWLSRAIVHLEQENNPEEAQKDIACALIYLTGMYEQKN